MSRILKYKESLHRFIKEKSCLTEDNFVNTQTNSYIYSIIKDDDLIMSILMLTVMNNQNKKNHISMQGYYVASCIEFLNVVINIIEKRHDIINKNGNDFYIKMYNNLINYSSKSLNQNLESIKNVFQPQNMINILLQGLNIYDGSVKIINSFIDYKVNMSNKNCNNDIINWYLKDNKELVDKFKKLKQITKDSINDFIEKKYTTLCEMSIIIGYILGGGDLGDINKLKKQGKHFSIMYKISKDFETLEDDIKNCDTYTFNYIINFGLQDAYEKFLSAKQKFIEEAMVQDTYTNTIKEIIDILESKVDIIIDNTSPDLKSNFSSAKT